MSIPRFGNDNAENGILIKLFDQWAVIKRHSNSEKICVSRSEFLQNNVKPTIGKIYRYNFFTSSSGLTKITNIRPVLQMKSAIRAEILGFEAKAPLSINACIDWFDWDKGYGAVMMLADESTAFIHMSLVEELLQEYGFSFGIDMKGQEVYVVVIPDPEKKLRVTRIEFL